MVTLLTNIEQLTKVGKTVAEQLNRVGVTKVVDLLFYFPSRYEDFSDVVPIGEVQPGSVSVRGVIELIENRRSYRRRMIVTDAVIDDGTGAVKAIWFHQPYLTKMYKPGDEVFLSGKLSDDSGQLTFVNPLCEKVRDETLHTARIIPIYSTTKNLSQKQIRFLVKQALAASQEVQDWLPDNILEKSNLVGLVEALEEIHFPTNQTKLHQAISRLKFNELLLHQLKIQLSRKDLEDLRSQPLPFLQSEVKKFVTSLPFDLTNDQKVTAWHILNDMEKTKPMNRLLEGEVGSGKTLVAIIALLNCALQKYQSVFMAPTEILAEQHYHKVMEFLQEFPVKIALLTRHNKSVDGKTVTKAALLKKIKAGDVDIMIGTHALISEDVDYRNLGLAVIDEQHRFGVDQRRLLKQKSGEQDSCPHLLSMTATPIPRTLSLILYGDLDLSIIKQLPKGRKKIITKVVSSENREKAYGFIAQKVAEGQQVFVVCPLIDPSDKLGVKSVSDEYEKLDKKIFPNIKIDILHGKLKANEQDRIVKDFLANKTKILVATSIIEVGVDIPNATVMMIEGSDRFGLSQLYQFRGRVGRSELQAYCFLFTDSTNAKSQKRLEALITAKDSFELAQKDLELRGPGEVYGTQQSGFPAFKLAQLTDLKIIKDTKSWAEKIMSYDLQKYPLLAEKIQSIKKTVHFE